MAKLQVQFFSDSDYNNVNKGSNLPTWWTGTDVSTNKSTWYSGVENDYYFYNLITQSTDRLLYFQFGQNRTGWATNRFIRQRLNLDNEVEHDNGDISVDVSISDLLFKTRQTDYIIAGVRVQTKLTINGQTIWEYSGMTSDEKNLTSSVNPSFSVTVKPQQRSTATALHMFTHYPDGEYPDTEATFGFSLFNPNLPEYVPMAIRKSGGWKDLDRNNGKICIRKSSVWLDKSKELNSGSRQPNVGHNRIRRSGIWRQLPKMTNGTAP